MGRDYKRSKGDSGRDAGGFCAIPWAVLDSPAYARLSHPAKALLMEFARQFVRDNNGKLLASRAYLNGRGWRSSDVITRAVRELVAAGFIHQTVQGHRPNKAAWYAVTWRALDRNPGYDHGAAETFQRGAYRNGPSAPSPGTEARNKPAQKSYMLTPSPGTEGAPIAPSPGTEKAPPVPSPGTVEGVFSGSPVPSPGHHLEKPSVASEVTLSEATQHHHQPEQPALLTDSNTAQAEAAPPADGAGTTPPRRSIKGRIVAALLTGPKESPELDAILGTSAAPHVRKRMVLDGVAYSVTAERIPPVPGRSGFGARYALTPLATEGEARFTVPAR